MKTRATYRKCGYYVLYNYYHITLFRWKGFIVDAQILRIEVDQSLLVTNVKILRLFTVSTEVSASPIKQLPLLVVYFEDEALIALAPATHSSHFLG
jgi:hypothetical protein